MRHRCALAVHTARTARLREQSDRSEATTGTIAGQVVDSASNVTNSERRTCRRQHRGRRHER